MIDDVVMVRARSKRIWQTGQRVGSVFDCGRNRPGLAALLQSVKAGRKASRLLGGRRLRRSNEFAGRQGIEKEAEAEAGAGGRSAVAI